MSAQKKIQQSTYDDVIRENVEDLEMEPEEAIEDAVIQFKSQGVSLNGIVTNPSVIKTETGVDVIHNVKVAVEKLKKLSEDPLNNNDDIKSQLNIIKDECNLSAAHRYLAANIGTFPIIISLWKTKHLSDVTLALAALVNGQPDLFDEPSLKLLRNSLAENVDDVILIPQLLNLIYLSCLKHEGNRQALVNNDILTPLIECLKTHRTTPEIVQKSCAVLRALILDDDIRVEFGKAHEHAKDIVIKHEALSLLSELLQESPDVASASDIVLTLSRLLVRHEFCKDLADSGGLTHLFKALKEHDNHQSFVQNVLYLIKALAGNDHVQKEIVKENGVEAVINSTQKHITKPGVCKAACGTLASLALRSPPHCALIVENGGASLITRAMDVHGQELGVQKHACLAIRNLVARSREHAPTFLDLGVETLIRNAQERHSGLSDEAKAALRDLGCPVELRELWTGKKGGLQN